MQRMDVQTRGGCMGMGRGGYGKRFRDGSCAGFGLGQSRGKDRGFAQCPNWPPQSANEMGRGFFGRFFGSGKPVRSPSVSGLDWIKSAIDDLQRQINELRSQADK